jgi:hypothetical protein
MLHVMSCVRAFKRDCDPNSTNDFYPRLQSRFLTWDVIRSDYIAEPWKLVTLPLQYRRGGTVLKSPHRNANPV